MAPENREEPGGFGPGIYLHHPFCAARCGYCDFFTAVGPPAAQRGFVRDLELEIGLAAAQGQFPGARFQTVFFGGGTPSLLTGAQMKRLLGRLRESFRLADEGEITAECNPESITPGRMAAFREAGINRVSLGVQSMAEDELKMLDRIHGAEAVRRRVRQLRRAGFASVSLDLIYGLPGSDAPRWRRTLEEALALEPDHLSAYLLALEPRVKLHRKLHDEGTSLPSGEEARAQYELLREMTARAGLIQYEISNFARPGHECRHNLNYWTRGEYLGLGPSAHSHAGGQRWANVSSMPEYRAAVRAGRLPRTLEEAATAERVAEEWIFLGLRCARGVSWERLAAACGDRREALSAKVEQLSARGLLQRAHGRLKLAPEAYFVSDGVFTELMLALG